MGPTSPSADRNRIPRVRLGSLPMARRSVTREPSFMLETTVPKNCSRSLCRAFSEIWQRLPMSGQATDQNRLRPPFPPSYVAQQRLWDDSSRRDRTNRAQSANQKSGSATSPDAISQVVHSLKTMTISDGAANSARYTKQLASQWHANAYSSLEPNLCSAPIGRSNRYEYVPRRPHQLMVDVDNAT